MCTPGFKAKDMQSESISWLWTLGLSLQSTCCSDILPVIHTRSPKNPNSHNSNSNCVLLGAARHFNKQIHSSTQTLEQLVSNKAVAPSFLGPKPQRTNTPPYPLGLVPRATNVAFGCLRNLLDTYYPNYRYFGPSKLIKHHSVAQLLPFLVPNITDVPSSTTPISAGAWFKCIETQILWSNGSNWELPMKSFSSRHGTGWRVKRATGPLWPSQHLAWQRGAKDGSALLITATDISFGPTLKSYQFGVSADIPALRLCRHGDLSSSGLQPPPFLGWPSLYRLPCPDMDCLQQEVLEPEYHSPPLEFDDV